jgi:hypothetical protein
LKEVFSHILSYLSDHGLHGNIISSENDCDEIAAVIVVLRKPLQNHPVESSQPPPFFRAARAPTPEEFASFIESSMPEWQINLERVMSEVSATVSRCPTSS